MVLLGGKNAGQPNQRDKMLASDLLCEKILIDSSLVFRGDL
jgi:hypothetical protein